MNRARSFGLALIAVVALCGLAAPAAGAANFTADEYPTVLEGGQVTTHKFTFGTTRIECADVTFKAELTKAATELTVFPEFGGCLAHIFEATEPVTFTFGCDLGLVASSATEGSLNIKCAAGKAIAIDIGAICTITISGQGPLNGLKYKNLGGTGGIEVTTGANLLAKSSGLFCPKGEVVSWTGTTIYTFKSGKTSLPIHGDVG